MGIPIYSGKYVRFNIPIGRGNYGTIGRGAYGIVCNLVQKDLYSSNMVQGSSILSWSWVVQSCYNFYCKTSGDFADLRGNLAARHMKAELQMKRRKHKLFVQVTIVSYSQSQEGQHQVPSALRLFSVSHKEKTLSELARDKWLNLTEDGNITLGMNSFLDLRSWFRNNDIPSCHVCNEAAVKVVPIALPHPALFPHH